MNRALACLALAGLAAVPRVLGAQDMPEALKDSALAVRVQVFVPKVQESGAQGASLSPWQAQSVKNTLPGTPVRFRFVGSNVVILVRVTPFDKKDGKGLVLVAEGQVWVKPPEGGLSSHTTIDTLSIDYGETVFFFPLGVDPAGKAPIRLEIAVLRAADMPAPQGDGGDDKGGAGDKAGK